MNFCFLAISHQLSAFSLVFYYFSILLCSRINPWNHTHAHLSNLLHSHSLPPALWIGEAKILFSTTYPKCFWIIMPPVTPFFCAPTALDLVFNQSMLQTCRSYGAIFDFPGSLSTNLLPRWGIDSINSFVFAKIEIYRTQCQICLQAITSLFVIPYSKSLLSGKNRNPCFQDCKFLKTNNSVLIFKS